MRAVRDTQVRKLMEEMSKSSGVGRAAMKAGMDRKTGRKYIAVGKLPSEMVPERNWRTRTDPFEKDWPEVETWLKENPGFEVKTIFELLQQKHPDSYEEGQIRTLQRRVHRWRAEHGPDKEVVFGQQHRPGEAAQTDCTSTAELKVTVAGQLFTHLLCVFVLPYSNWQWATVCLSESMAALRKGVQRALFQLGRVPSYHQTDNSTAATHRIPDGKSVVLEGRSRPFNEDYLALMRHFGMTPRTIEVGASEQNGDVEASNGALKRRLEQALLVRGSRDFESVDAWQEFVDTVTRKANQGRGNRVSEELGMMRLLDVARLPEFIEEPLVVSTWSTIRIKHCAYSVPSRLIGEEVKVRLYEDRLEVVYAGKVELACERLVGRNLKRIDYRHVIWSLVRKPGAFARYVYREEMFPSLTFRRAYDAILLRKSGLKADVEYLRILFLAASTMETEVEAALSLLLEAGTEVTSDAVKSLVSTTARTEAPALVQPEVRLKDYDLLLEGSYS